jgi:hypothetical protein
LVIPPTIATLELGDFDFERIAFDRVATTARYNLFGTVKRKSRDETCNFSCLIRDDRDIARSIPDSIRMLSSGEAITEDKSTCVKSSERNGAVNVNRVNVILCSVLGQRCTGRGNGKGEKNSASVSLLIWETLSRIAIRAGGKVSPYGHVTRNHWTKARLTVILPGETKVEAEIFARNPIARSSRDEFILPSKSLSLHQLQSPCYLRSITASSSWKRELHFTGMTT